MGEWQVYLELHTTFCMLMCIVNHAIGLHMIMAHVVHVPTNPAKHNKVHWHIKQRFCQCLQASCWLSTSMQSKGGTNDAWMFSLNFISCESNRIKTNPYKNKNIWARFTKQVFATVKWCSLKFDNIGTTRTCLEIEFFHLNGSQFSCPTTGRLSIPIFKLQPSFPIV